MTLYYLQDEMSLFLNDILGNLLDKVNKLSLRDIAITWINYKTADSKMKRFGCGINLSLIHI